jgi:hypothetical protein
MCDSVPTAAVLVPKLLLRSRNAAPRRIGKLSFGESGYGRLNMSSFAWIVLGLIAGVFCSSLGDGAGVGGVMDVVLGSALLLVIYGAVSRDATPD